MHRRRFLQGSAAGLVGTAGSHRSAAAQTEYGPLGRLRVTNAREVVVDGTDAYVATGDGIAVVDVSDPTAPTMLAERTGLLAADGRAPLDLLWDVQVGGDRLVAVGPAQSTATGSNGAVLFDVSEPSDPRVLDTERTTYAIHNAAFDDGFVYLTGNNGRDHPVVIFDVTRDEFIEIARWSLLDYDSNWGAVVSGLRNLHDVVVSDGRAYLLYWDAGTWILDVSDPASPTLLGRLPAAEPSELTDVSFNPALLALPGNHHGGAISDDGSLFALGIEAWTIEDGGSVRGSPGGVELWDVSDPSTPERLSRISAPPSPDNTRGGGQFTTAHNCDIAGDRLYTSWYFGGVKRHDISDPASPTEQLWWKDAPTASFWTAEAVSGEDFFVAGSANEAAAFGAVYTFPERTGGVQQTTPSSENTDSDGSPGFGFGAALGTLGLGAWQLRRLADRSE
jgi:hypothetical protein